MPVLALDTSTNVCTVALIEGDGPGYEVSLPVKTGHAGSLLPTIEELFGMSPYTREDIDLIAVGIGPGSFTGIRIGIATAKGLSLALGVKLAGVNTLDALAHAALPSSMQIMPVIDARKSEIFCRMYASDGTPLTDPMNIRPEAMAGIVTERTLFMGNGVPLYRDAFTKTVDSNYVEGPVHLWYPRASVIARMALSDLAGGTLRPAQPLYVRASDAVISLEKRK